MSVLNDCIYLCGCAVNGIKPDQERVAAMDIEKLLQFSNSHSIAAIVSIALESVNACSDAFREVQLNSVRKNMLLDFERKKIVSFMNENHIWHLPLKGILLKEFYPKAGMRQMSDNDILYDAAYQEKLYAFMTDNGYESVRFHEGIVDEYHKEPLFNFEMHTALFAENDGTLPHFYNYYQNVYDRLQKESEDSMTMRFSNEDFYVYLLAHAYKHYTWCGVGLRTLLDSYVFLQKYEQIMDWDIIQNACSELKMGDFEVQTRLLCKELFEDPEHIVPSPERLKMLEFYASSGTFGSMENRVANQLKELQTENEPVSFGTKLRYLYHRFVLTDNIWERLSPFAYRHRWARPFVRIYQVIAAFFTKRTAVKSEFKSLFRKK